MNHSGVHNQRCSVLHIYGKLFIPVFLTWKLYICKKPYQLFKACLLADDRKFKNGKSLASMTKLAAKSFLFVQGQGLEMVIDGMTLSKVLGDSNREMMLASLIVNCSGVIVCRASPAQKAAIVLMMKQYHAMKEVLFQMSSFILQWNQAENKTYQASKSCVTTCKWCVDHQVCLDEPSKCILWRRKKSWSQ